MYHCLDCGSDSFFNAHELEAHIASDHLNLCPYECEKCRYAKFPTEYTLVNHCRSDHGMFEFTIKYRYSSEIEQKRVQLADRLQRCLAFHNNHDKNNSSVATPSPSANSLFNVKTEEQSSSSSSNAVLDNPPIPNHSPHPSFGYPPYPSYDDQMMMRNVNNSVEPPEKKRRNTLACTMCGDHISQQRSSMIYHVNTRHSKFDMFECGICNKTWQTIAKSDVLKHMKAHHEKSDGSVDMSSIIDNRRSLSQKLKEATIRCFPKHKPHSKPLCRGTSPPLTVKGYLERKHDNEEDVFDIEEDD